MSHEANQPHPEMARQAAEAYLAERQEWMADAVGIYAPDRDRTLDPLEIFPKPDAVRADAPVPALTPGQETALREIAGRFGIGGEADVLSGADWQINEGGKARKVDAEAKLNEEAKAIIYSGSPDRIIGQDEIDYMRERLGKGLPVEMSEYGMVRQIAGLQEGFEPLQVPEIEPYGYDIYANHALIGHSIGQLLKIGTQRGAGVYHLRVDRRNYFDETEQKWKFDNRPDTFAIMGFIGGVLGKKGDHVSSVGMNTSNTYASRVIDTVRRGLEHGRTFSVGMYGRQTLAAVEHKEAAEPTEIQHIPGELYVMQTKLLELREALGTEDTH